MNVPQNESMAARVRAELAKLFAAGTRRITASELCGRLELACCERLERQRVHAALKDLAKAGTISRLERGVYGPPDGRPAAKQAERRHVMWRLLRMRRAVSVEDLVELAAVSGNYATEWLQTMARQGVARRDGKIWRLINDPVTYPEPDDNAAKLRRLRARRKALEALGRLENEVASIRAALEDEA